MAPKTNWGAVIYQDLGRGSCQSYPYVSRSQ
jgi:hypothetical protein